VLSELMLELMILMTLFKFCYAVQCFDAVS